MMVPVAICRTLLTVPPFPCPRSFKTSKSSLFRSSLYSIPISSCAVCLAFSPLLPPGICRSLSEGATVRGAGAAKASPFTFLRFSVRTEPMASDIVTSCCELCSALWAVRRRGSTAECCSFYGQQVRGGQCWRIAGDAEAISREHRPLSNLIGISPGPGKYTQGCRGGCRIYSQLSGSGSRFWSTNSSGLAFGATSRTWGSALLCGTRAGKAGSGERKSSSSMFARLEDIFERGQTGSRMGWSYKHVCLMVLRFLHGDWA
jgi:hypothetical protein